MAREKFERTKIGFPIDYHENGKNWSKTVKKISNLFF